MSSATVAVEAEATPHDLELLTEGVGSEERTQNGLAMVVFSGDLDKALAAMIIANGAAAGDMPVSMFFTFGGLNVLRREHPVHVPAKTTVAEGMFGRVMPRGPGHLHLSQTNMAGHGTRMIKREMAKQHVSSLGELIRSAQEPGVRFIACTMSTDLLGIRKEELIPGIRFGNVGSFLDAADTSRSTLFI